VKIYAKWIAEGIKKEGKSAIGLAKALTKALKLKKPMHRTTIYKMTDGSRKIYSHELAPIAAYIEESIPNVSVQSSLENLQTLRIEREIGAGFWREADEESVPDIGTIVVPTDFEYPTATHIAYRMKGDCMTSAGILDGDTLICIAPVEEKLSDGKQVVIERLRAGLIETSPRVVKIHKDHIEYICSGHKPVITPLSGSKKKVNDTETVTVVAIIRRITRILN
jgi:SOS-response transcriptional repressor LexA